MKNILIFFVAIFLIFCVWIAFILLGLVSIPFHAASNTVQMGHDVIDSTLNADNGIYNYEWFRSRYEEIKAAENNIKSSNTQIESFEKRLANQKWSSEDTNEYYRLQAVKQGQMAYLESIVGEYNARSKMANRNIFKDGLFPQVLEFGSNIL